MELLRPRRISPIAPRGIFLKCVSSQASDGDALRMLLSIGGRSQVDVAILAGEARMVAYQNIVSREMSES